MIRGPTPDKAVLCLLIAVAFGPSWAHFAGGKDVEAGVCLPESTLLLAPFLGASDFFWNTLWKDVLRLL